jgi:2-polyprenyl-6-methoxyphenol hydroxylase-like FAD-dependent oxidoreductase
VSVRRALVIGGSLGGHFVAGALRAIGWHVDIFERSTHELDSRGGGIGFQPEILEAFRFSNVNVSSELGVHCDQVIYLDRHDNVLQRVSAPCTLTSWNMLYGLMKRAHPAEQLHNGQELVGAHVRGDQVEAIFSSGRREVGDLLIGADGPHSTVRRLVLPDIAPSYAGYVAWRGLVPENELAGEAELLREGPLAFQQGPSHQFLTYLVPGGDGSTAIGRRRWNWVWYRKLAAGDAYRSQFTDRHGHVHTYSLPPGALQAWHEAELGEASRTWLTPIFQALVARTKEPFVQAILDLEVPQMVFGRMILLGDAAFVARPHTAGGTAKAAANAVALANALQAVSNMDKNLSDWNTEQVRLGHDMIMRGIALGDRIVGAAEQQAVVLGGRVWDSVAPTR